MAGEGAEGSVDGDGAGAELVVVAAVAAAVVAAEDSVVPTIDGFVTAFPAGVSVALRCSCMRVLMSQMGLVTRHTVAPASAADSRCQAALRRGTPNTCWCQDFMRS